MPRAQLGVDGRRGRLLDDLLVAALDRALPLEEVDDVAVLVGEDLHLDVAGRSTYRSRNTVPSPKAEPPPAARSATASTQLVGARRPGACRARRRRRGLDQHRVAGARRPSGEWPSSSRPVTSPPGSTGTPAAAMRALAASLEPIASIASGGGPTQVSPAAMTARANAGVLGQEAVARVDGVGAGPRARRRRAGRRAGTCRPGSTPGRRTARRPRARTARRRRRRSRPRPCAMPSRAAGAEDPAGDLAPVGDQQRRPTGASASHPEDAEAGRRRAPRRRGRPTAPCRARCGCRGDR